MSFTITLTGTSTFISQEFEVAIYLDEDPMVQYEIGRANFDSFNMISNVDETNNILFRGEQSQYKVKNAIGSYELNNVIEEMKRKILELDDKATIHIVTNIHTARVVITSNRRINFQVENSIGFILGFNKRILEAKTANESNDQVRILRTNTICVDCNIATGSYLNSKPVHIIHKFFPSVPDGYKIVESPLNIIYHSVGDKSINSIVVRITDQKGNLLDFRGEEITIRLHIIKRL